MSVDERAVPRVPSARADPTDPNDGPSQPSRWSDMPATASRRHVNSRARRWTTLDTAPVPFAHGKVVPAALLPWYGLGIFYLWLGYVDDRTIETIREGLHRLSQHQTHIAAYLHGCNPTRM